MTKTKTVKGLRIAIAILIVMLATSMMPTTVWAEAAEETPETGIVATAASALDVTKMCDQSTKTATFTWEDLGTDVSYMLSVDGEAVAASFDTTTEAGKVSTSYTFENTNTEYKVVVAAEQAGEVIAQSEELSVVFLDGELEGIKSYSSYNSVDLEWKELAGATGYNVYMDGELVGTTKDNEYRNISVTDEAVHKFKVVAVVDGDETTVAANISDTKFNAIKYKGTMTKTVKLTCWTSGHKKHTITLKSGQKIVFDKFSDGRYRTTLDGDHYINVKRIYLKSISASGYYDYKHPYSDKEAERYINRRGVSSKKSGLVLVSTKSQRVYLFQGSKGKWKIDKAGKYNKKSYKNTDAGNWVISTGSSSTPTPTGETKFKYKWRTHNTLSYWSVCNTFSFHSKNPKWKLGGPKSGGCIRNEKEQAHYIYDKYKCGTKVVIY